MSIDPVLAETIAIVYFAVSGVVMVVTAVMDGWREMWTKRDGREVPLQNHVRKKGETGAEAIWRIVTDSLAWPLRLLYVGWQVTVYFVLLALRWLTTKPEDTSNVASKE